MTKREAKPTLHIGQIFNISMGFLGIQFGYALQNANASRILLTFGADISQLSWFWLAAPITGMIVQPIVGHYSDQTWTRLGRRRPYFLIGSILTAIALVLMPNAGVFAHFLPAMFIGAGFLMIMDASINIAMEPFRALVADMLPTRQTTTGFSIQTFLIGVGAVVGSWLPYLLAEWFGVEKTSLEGEIPTNVKWSFYTGAIVLMLTILWTVLTTKEYSPERLRSFEGTKDELPTKSRFWDIYKDIRRMPQTMRQLGVVQFFTWMALFLMWVFTTPAVAQHIYGVATDDTSSSLYQDAGNWVGVVFGVYNGVAMLYALIIPNIAHKMGRKTTYALSLLMGAVGLFSIYFITHPTFLLFSMIGIGVAWGSILAMPYAILAPSLPLSKMGVYMGIFNFFITIPQIIIGLFGGVVIQHFFHSQAIYAMVFAGILLVCASISLYWVNDTIAQDEKNNNRST